MIRSLQATSRTRALAARLALAGMTPRRRPPIRRRFLVALVLAGATLLPAVANAQSGPRTIAASGTFALVAPPEVRSFQVVGDTTFIVQRVQYRLTGTLAGTAVGEEQVTYVPNQTAVLRAELVFTGTVEGHAGTVRLVLDGRGTDMTRGQFVLLGGTGDLASLRGQGTVEGSPQTGSGTYAGEFQFGP